VHSHLMMSDKTITDTLFLHVLLTDPAKVIPPGKSLLAMLSSVQTPERESPLHKRVKDAVYPAFWNEASPSFRLLARLIVHRHWKPCRPPSRRCRSRVFVVFFSTCTRL